MKARRPSSDGYIQIIIVIALAIVIAVAVFLFLNRNHTAAKPTPKTAGLSSRCVGQNFTGGSSGRCVRDVQTLVNYMEHSGLTECPFREGATLTVSSIYDAATARQVLAVQQWASCYAAQEGFSSSIQQSGTVNRATWGELCTYGYTNPLHNGASGATASIAAGKDAGCAALNA